MLQFIKGIQLNEMQLTFLMQLLLETGYYENTAQNNKLGLSPVEFHKQQVLKPSINDIYVLMNGLDIVGLLYAAPKKHQHEVSEHIPNLRRDDPVMQACLDQINDFYEQGFDDDFILYGIAVAPKYRGQGYFKILFNYLFDLAKENGSKRIIFTVRDSNPAVEIYKHYGAKVLGALDFRHYFKDQLLKCEIVL